MSTAMDKPLNGAGLAVVNHIFNERLNRLEGGGSGSVDWAETPFTGMTHFNNSSAFGCAWLETEKISSMARIVRGDDPPSPSLVNADLTLLSLRTRTPHRILRPERPCPD